MKHASGFTLVELLLSLSLFAALSIAMLSWTVHFVGKTRQSTQQSTDLAYYWLHWLWGDVQNSQTVNAVWEYNPQDNCLLYGVYGVRVKNNALQWRPVDKHCSSAGWQALNDTYNVRFKRLSLKTVSTVLSLCLQYASPQTPRNNEEVCLPWPLL